MHSFLQYIQSVSWRRSGAQRIEVFQNVDCVKTACFEGKFGKVLGFTGPKQVHGTRWVSSASLGDGDAVYTNATGTSEDPVGVVTADCLPLLYVNSQSQTAGAVHLGWKGLVSGILSAAPDQAQLKSECSYIALGPCISLRSFEVGPEVLEKFRERYQEKMKELFWLPIAKGKEDRWHIDLQLFALFDLFELKLDPKKIEVYQVDTVVENHHWFSYRCENPTGRNLACISLKK
jgi:YfiH family protein